MAETARVERGARAAFRRRRKRRRRHARRRARCRGRRCRDPRVRRRSIRVVQVFVARVAPTLAARSRLAGDSAPVVVEQRSILGLDIPACGVHRVGAGRAAHERALPEAHVAGGRRRLRRRCRSRRLALGRRAIVIVAGGTELGGRALGGRSRLAHARRRNEPGRSTRVYLSPSSIGSRWSERGPTAG